MRKPTKNIIHVVVDKSIYHADKVRLFYDLDEAINEMNSRANSYETNCEYHLWDDETEIPYFYNNDNNRYLEVNGNILWQVYVLSLPVY